MNTTSQGTVRCTRSGLSGRRIPFETGEYVETSHGPIGRVVCVKGYLVLLAIVDCESHGWPKTGQQKWFKEQSLARIPNPGELAAALESIQAQWSPTEWQSRQAVQDETEYTPPVIRTPVGSFWGGLV